VEPTEGWWYVASEREGIDLVDSHGRWWWKRSMLTLTPDMPLNPEPNIRSGRGKEDGGFGRAMPAQQEAEERRPGPVVDALAQRAVRGEQGRHPLHLRRGTLMSVSCAVAGTVVEASVPHGRHSTHTTPHR
jgi:hypothetical protein